MTPAYVYLICSACRVSSDCGPGDEATCGLFWRSRGSAGLVPPRDDPEHRWFRLRAEPCSVSSCHEARQLDGCSSARIAPWRMATSCAIELAEFAGRREACTASSDRLHTHARTLCTHAGAALGGVAARCGAQHSAPNMDSTKDNAHTGFAHRFEFGSPASICSYHQR